MKKVKDVKDIVFSTHTNLQPCILWNMAEGKEIGENRGCAADYATKEYADWTLHRIEADGGYLVLIISKEG